MAHADFTEIINDFLTAELGEDVRDSLVAIARALEDAINTQIASVTADLDSTDPNAALSAGVVGDSLKNIGESLFVTPRLSIEDDGLYVFESGYYSGEVGETITFTKPATKYAKLKLPQELRRSAMLVIPDGFEAKVRTTLPGDLTIVNIAGFASKAVFISAGADLTVDAYVDFRRSDGEALTTADYNALHAGFRVFYSALSSVRGSYKMALEHGVFSPGNKLLNDHPDSFGSFYTHMRTPLFLDVSQCQAVKVTSTKYDVIKMVCYGADYRYTEEVTLTSGVYKPVTNRAVFVRFTVSKSNGETIDFAEDSLTMDTIGGATVRKAVDNLINGVQTGANMTFAFIVGGQIGRDTTSADTQSRALVDSTAIIRLPPNYSNTGEAVPLVIYAHGSDDYTHKWPIRIREEIGNREVIDYLVNEGYAVLDAYGHSSDAPITDGYAHTYGDMDCMNCYATAIRRVLQVYNLRSDGVYVTGISSGGLTALNLAFGGAVHVRACAPLAPAISVYNRFLGYTEQQRKEYAWAMGFSGDDSVLNGANGEAATAYSIPVIGEELLEYFTANAEKTIGYNPMWNGMTGVQIDQLLAWGLQRYGQNRLGGGDRDETNWVDKIRTAKTPIKIWIADDDHNVPPEIIYNFLTTLKNGQNIAELRLVPDGRGGHYAFTSSATAKRVSGVTALGIAYTGIPDAWIEMIAFFRRY